MLHFACTPDAVFSKFLTSALENAIQLIEKDIENDAPEEILFFEEQILRAFGGGIDGAKLLLRELKKLLQAHLSPKCYMPTDRHFQLLDRVISAHCDLYNDGLWDPKLRYKRKRIQTLDFECILEFFFWDIDYDFSPEVAIRLMKLKRRSIPGDTLRTLSDSALAASAGLPVDGIDLILEEIDSSSDLLDESSMNCLWLNR